MCFTGVDDPGRDGGDLGKGFCNGSDMLSDKVSDVSTEASYWEISIGRVTGIGVVEEDLCLGCLYYLTTYLCGMTSNLHQTMLSTL